MARAPWRHSSDDPTATKTLRKRYSGEMYRRFLALKGAILVGIEDRDAFGLREGGERVRTNAAQFTAAERAAFTAQADNPFGIEPPDRGAFDFPSDEQKIDEFASWLDEQVGRGILERERHNGRTVAGRRSWQNQYIRQGYAKGVTHADHAAVNMGVIDESMVLDDVFNAPRHVDAAGLMYSRAYRELDGVTSDMGRQMGRILTEGLTQGYNPHRMARELNGRVDNVGIHRGRMIARTETIRAHNEGALNRYEDMSGRIEGVTIVPEFTTAGDNNVCDECADLEGKTYDSFDEARGVIPRHPNCRCTFIPVRLQVDDAASRSARGRGRAA